MRTVPVLHRLPLLAALGLASALTLAGGPAAAQYTASSWVQSDASASTSYSSMVGSTQEDASSLGAPLSKQAHAYNSDDYWHSLTGEDWSWADASATPGALHLSARSEAISKSTQVCQGCLGGANAVAHASANASFSDVASLNFAGMAPGTKVRATFVIHVDGDLLAGAAGNSQGQQVAQVNWTFWLNGVHYDANGGYGYRLWLIDGNVADSATIPGTVLMQSTLTLGQDFGISMAASVSSQASAYSGINYRPVGAVDEGSGYGVAGFANSFAWGGLVGLTDMDGNPLDKSLAGIASSSGFNYAQAYVATVPEPGAAALLLSGLLALCWLHSRRRG